jgi:tetratricopeptide (TPR) repeat protein
MRLLVTILSVLVLLFAPALLPAQSLPTDAARRQAIDHYLSGQQMLASERYDRAVAAFRRAVELHPLLTDAHYGLGHAFMGLRRYTSAAQAFEECLLAARTIHGLRDQARVAADRALLDEADEIRDTLRRRGDTSLRARQIEEYLATRLRKRSSMGLPFEAPAPLLLALGSAHFRNGDRTRAEYYWREATGVDPALGEAWNNLAAIFAATARRDEAVAALSHAERAGFRVNPQLKQAIERMP